MTPEGRTKQAVEKILVRESVYHFFPAANGYGRAGIPDIICCINGFFLAIECKAGANKPTALQQRELNLITLASGAALVVTDDLTTQQELLRVIQFIKDRTWKS
jgi:Holliday junction resolvase